MVRKISAKRLLLGETWQENQVVTIADGYVSEIRPGNRGDVACETLTAGLFDTHSHGGEGYYTIWADEKSLNHFLQELARHGVNIVIYANQLTRSAFPAMQSTATDILRYHRAQEVDARLMPIKQIISLIDEL